MQIPRNIALSLLRRQDWDVQPRALAQRPSALRAIRERRRRGNAALRRASGRG